MCTQQNKVTNRPVSQISHLQAQGHTQRGGRGGVGAACGVRKTQNPCRHALLFLYSYTENNYTVVSFTLNTQC